MNETKFTDLIDQYLTGNISLTGKEELTEMLEQPAYREKLEALMEKAFQDDVFEGDPNESLRSLALEYLHKKINEEKKVVHIHRSRWWAVAASIILILGAGSYFLFFNNSSRPSIAKNSVNDVKPGSYKARLTLSDGRNIILDSAALGEVAKQGNTSVINKDGQLVYQPGIAEQSIVYNTVTTAKGETYTMTLADGSKVWLNSGSSIHFPVTFSGKERRIEVTGEVYVKVAHNPAQPFIASANGMEVLALGTEFNINSYSDEDNISATLIEGSVKVSKDKSTTLLKPGQQTQLSSAGILTAARDVNTNEITAWKDGWFHFESADLKTILRQFARWYDVEIVYEGPVTDRKFLAIVKRSSTLKNVLEMLQDNNIVYRIEGKKLIVKSG